MVNPKRTVDAPSLFIMGHRNRQNPFIIIPLCHRTYKNRAFEAHPRRLHYKFGEKAKWRDLIAQGPLPVGA